MTGITPTYMGNTTTQLNCRTEHKDHPHVHGEYLQTASIAPIPPGSPPRTWGIPWIHFNRFEAVGITPTYMGNTSLPLPPFWACRDHPHVHGEYNTAKAEQDSVAGSPPRTWGIPTSSKSGMAEPGITPTYMGNTVILPSLVGK